MRLLARLPALCLMLSSLLLASCGKKENSSATSVAPPSAPAGAPLVVATIPWPGFDVLLYADVKGIFAQRGLNVKFVSYTVNTDIIRAVERGQADIALDDIRIVADSPVMADPTVFIGITDESNGADGIVAAPGITSVEQLAGKEITAKLGTLSQLVLLEALSLHGMKQSDVKIADLTNPVALEAFSKGEYPAATLWEPDLSAAEAAVKGKVIFRTNELDSLVIDTILARQSVLKNRREEVKKFLLCWLDVMHAIEAKPDEVFRTVADVQGVKAEDFARDYNGLRRGDAAFQTRCFGEERFLEKSYAKMLSFMEEHSQSQGRTPQPFREDTLILEAMQEWRPLP